MLVLLFINSSKRYHIVNVAAINLIVWRSLYYITATTFKIAANQKRNKKLFIHPLHGVLILRHLSRAPENSAFSCGKSLESHITFIYIFPILYSVSNKTVKKKTVPLEVIKKRHSDKSAVHTGVIRSHAHKS